MKARVFMPWFEKLNKAYQILMVVGGLFGILGTCLGVAGAITVRVMDARIRYQVEPIREMSEYALRASGLWEGFIKDQEEKERDRKAMEGRRAARQGLEPWRAN